MSNGRVHTEFNSSFTIFYYSEPIFLSSLEHPRLRYQHFDISFTVDGEYKCTSFIRLICVCIALLVWQLTAPPKIGRKQNNSRNANRKKNVLAPSTTNVDTAASCFIQMHGNSDCQWIATFKTQFFHCFTSVAFAEIVFFFDSEIFPINCFKTIKWWKETTNDPTATRFGTIESASFN